jgi:pimeloyl-ACP methyl ester carboxylesterase
VFSSTSNARFTTAVNGDVVCVPRIDRALPPVLFVHSAAMSGIEGIGQGQLPSIEYIVDRVAREGYTVGCPTLGVEWGNATARGRIDDCLSWLRANTSATDDPAFLIGASMGACASLCWSTAHPTLVKGVVGIIPAIDLQAIRVANTGSLRASIDTAYGVTYPTALPSGSNPAAETATLAAVPQQLWYASNDAVSANISTYATAVGADLHSVGALSHSDASVAAVTIDTLVQFITDRT